MLWKANCFNFTLNCSAATRYQLFVLFSYCYDNIPNTCKLKETFILAHSLQSIQAILIWLQGQVVFQKVMAEQEQSIAKQTGDREASMEEKRYTSFQVMPIMIHLFPQGFFQYLTHQWTHPVLSITHAWRSHVSEASLISTWGFGRTFRYKTSIFYGPMCLHCFLYKIGISGFWVKNKI